MNSEKVRRGRKRGGKTINIELILPENEIIYRERMARVHIDLLNAQIARAGLTQEEVKELKAYISTL